MSEGGNYIRKTLRISAALDADIRQYCAVHNIRSESELYRAAIVSYIHSDIKDEKLALASLSSIQRKVQDMIDYADILMRYLSGMHLDIISYHAALPDDLRHAALLSARERVNVFEDGFREKLSRDGGSFFERLLSNFYTDDKKESVGGQP